MKKYWYEIGMAILIALLFATRPEMQAATPSLTQQQDPVALVMMDEALPPSLMANAQDMPDQGLLFGFE